MKPFDLINSLSNKSRHILSEEPLAEKEYNAFLTNRQLSQYYDTVMHSNLMNMHYDLDKKMQYDFYFYAVPKKNRYSEKWSSPAVKSEDLINITRAYDYSKKRATEIYDLLKPEQIKEINAQFEKGYHI